MTATSPTGVLLMAHSLGHGGSERQLANTALGLDRTKFRVHVASVLGGFQADALSGAGIPVMNLALDSFVNLQALDAARQLRSYVRRNGIRLVHAFDYTLSIFGVPVARTCRGVKVLSSQRCQMELLPPKYKLPFLWTQRLAHGVVANCEDLKQRLSVEYAYPAARISVCHNGLDTTRFFPDARKRAPGTEDASLVIGTVCVLRPEKNLPHLIEAFARIRAMRPGMKLLIVGSGAEGEALAAQSESLGVAGACVFLPSTPDVPSVLRSLDVFVHPSLTEGLPNGVMEAMACGCAVVASRVGGVPELIDDGKSGFLFDAGDLSGLIGALTRAVERDEVRAAVASAGAERMKEFSMARAAARMQAIYEQYLSQRSASVWNRSPSLNVRALQPEDPV